MQLWLSHWTRTHDQTIGTCNILKMPHKWFTNSRMRRCDDANKFLFSTSRLHRKCAWQITEKLSADPRLLCHTLCSVSIYIASILVLLEYMINIINVGTPCVLIVKCSWQCVSARSRCESMYFVVLPSFHSMPEKYRCFFFLWYHLVVRVILTYRSRERNSRGAHPTSLSSSQLYLYYIFVWYMWVLVWSAMHANLSNRSLQIIR